MAPVERQVNAPDCVHFARPRYGNAWCNAVCRIALSSLRLVQWWEVCFLTFARGGTAWTGGGRLLRIRRELAVCSATVNVATHHFRRLCVRDNGPPVGSLLVEAQAYVRHNRVSNWIEGSSYLLSNSAEYVFFLLLTNGIDNARRVKTSSNVREKWFSVRKRAAEKNGQAVLAQLELSQRLVDPLRGLHNG